MRIARVSDVPFQVTGLDEAVGRVVARAGRPDPIGLAVRLANACCVTLADERPDCAHLLSSRGVDLPDGATCSATPRSCASCCRS